ncbi:MAG: 50S ribosomal protein L20 [Candidatus Levybacteria bacterium CG10_big_fil_rev_8_21_14_0_10_35_13]|nr:MAG: 50S ribosomal protein L20 [Candidatus Levybacteria bacterium CG10_big_fil_rev_8_21_14_0_10_35_13]
MRVKRGVVSKRKHNKLKALTKGYRGTKHRLIKMQHEAALHAGAYAYHGRKLRKRDIRALWITRIGEAAKQEGISYSVLMNKLKKDKIELDRKILADLAVNDPETFKKIISSVK